jgi:hypothetical protein
VDQRAWLLLIAVPDGIEDHFHQISTASTGDQNPPDRRAQRHPRGPGMSSEPAHARGLCSTEQPAVRMSAVRHLAATSRAERRIAHACWRS